MTDVSMGWIRVCATSELLPGEQRVAWDGDTPILVTNLGTLQGGTFECVLTGGRFDLKTGEALCAPAYLPVRTFPVVVEDGAVWTRDDR